MTLQSTASLPAPSPAAPLQWTIESRTQAGTFYSVSQVTERGWSCSCPAGSWGRQCWHVRHCQAEVAELRRQLSADFRYPVPLVDDCGREEPEPYVCGICDVPHPCEHCPKLVACLCRARVGA